MLYTIFSVLLLWFGFSVLGGLALGRMMRQPSDEDRSEARVQVAPPGMRLVH
jgi:hypothetical protein